MDDPAAAPQEGKGSIDPVAPDDSCPISDLRQFPSDLVIPSLEDFNDHGSLGEAGLKKAVHVPVHHPEEAPRPSGSASAAFVRCA